MVRKLDKYDILVALFIKKGTTFSWNLSDIKREHIAYFRLIKKYPDYDFFYTLTDLHNKFNSLLGLLSKKNESVLETRYLDYLNNKEKNKTFDISDNKKEEISIISNVNKPKNILEFIK